MHDDTNDTSLDAKPPTSDADNVGGGGYLGERIAKLEARMDYRATKEDTRELKARMEHLATKEDTRQLEARMDYLATKEDTAKLEAQIEHLATREDIQSVKNDLMRWHLIVMGVAVAALGVLLRYFN